MAARKRPGPAYPRGKLEKLGKRVEQLSFLPNIDTMLMEGVPAPDVAKYIQDEMGDLLDVDHASLVNVLRARRRQKEEVARTINVQMDDEGFLRAGDDEDDGEEDDDDSIQAEVIDHNTPEVLARGLYERTRGGIKEILELEALYLSQRDRVGRLMQIENRRQIFARDVGMEIKIASDLLIARAKIKSHLGLDESSNIPELDMRRYSENTVRAMSNPESRHRILSLFQRLAKKSDDARADAEEQIALPPPPGSEDQD